MRGTGRVFFRTMVMISGDGQNYNYFRYTVFDTLYYNGDEYNYVHMYANIEHAISRIHTVTSNSHEDRSWSVTCRHSSKVETTCSWASYANQFNEELLFQCQNGVIAGYYYNFLTTLLVPTIENSIYDGSNLLVSSYGSTLSHRIFHLWQPNLRAIKIKLNLNRSYLFIKIQSFSIKRGFAFACFYCAQEFGAICLLG